jgi:predicted lipoprotein with Yx(FWY)xxD motif
MLSKRTRRVLALVPAAAALVATSACGAVTGASPSQANGDAAYSQPGVGQPPVGNGNLAAVPTAPPEPVPETEVPTTNDSANRMLAASQSRQLGAFVVNAHGFTVYRFDKDGTNPSKSNCVGECAKTWPPMLASERTMVSELDAGLLGTVERADGTAQVTFAGSPLYTYTGDRAPGRTSGQAKGGTWWAVTPDGKKVAGTGSAGTANTPPSSSAAAGSGATGY